MPETIPFEYLTSILRVCVKCSMSIPTRNTFFVFELFIIMNIIFFMVNVLYLYCHHQQLFRILFLFFRDNDNVYVCKVVKGNHKAFLNLKLICG